MTDLAQYAICKERGHESSGSVTGWENYSEYTCKYCGIHYWIRPSEIVEIDPPNPQKGTSND